MAERQVKRRGRGRLDALMDRLELHMRGVGARVRSALAAKRLNALVSSRLAWSVQIGGGPSGEDDNR